MGAHKPPLTQDQKDYIYTHWEKKTFRQMATKLHTSIEKVAAYMKQENLPYRKPGVKKKKKQVKDPEMFDYKEFGNWLIG